MEKWGNMPPQLVGVGLSIDALVSLSQCLLVKQPTSYLVYAITRQLEHFPGLQWVVLVPEWSTPVREVWNSFQETFCVQNFQRTLNDSETIFTGTRVGVFSLVAEEMDPCEEARLWLVQTVFQVMNIGCPGFFQSGLRNIGITVLGPVRRFS